MIEKLKVDGFKSLKNFEIQFQKGLNVPRMPEEEEIKILALENAIQEGIESGLATDFNPEKHLEILQLNKKNG